ncbi:MAG: hypothetical protein KKB81_01975 [Candidatus Margulisbacteria bacterium]|nr:hypothetical protein [Candidatus Margulisiibacteriota bacterium]MBU1022549.1 hypothetical protein [Candidatus Margulisiibacteriota bacterium]MBU1728835.1 hypothetical protein [Candidatus Margulisiibacteriota bacterium]MBU1955801.1 hypothetical protein [Candidatus Margulisiibacteriota bacterium]
MKTIKILLVSILFVVFVSGAAFCQGNYSFVHDLDDAKLYIDVISSDNMGYTIKTFVNGVALDDGGLFSNIEPNEVYYEVVKEDGRPEEYRKSVYPVRIILKKENGKQIATLVGAEPRKIGEKSAKLTIPPIAKIKEHKFFVFPDISTQYAAVLYSGCSDGYNLSSDTGDIGGLPQGSTVVLFCEKPKEKDAVIARAGLAFTEKSKVGMDKEGEYVGEPEFAMLDKNKGALYSGSLNPDKYKDQPQVVVELSADNYKMADLPKLITDKALSQKIEKAGWEYLQKLLEYEKKIMDGVEAGTITKEEAEEKLVTVALKHQQLLNPEYAEDPMLIFLAIMWYPSAQDVTKNKDEMIVQTFNRGNLYIFTADQFDEKKPLAEKDIAVLFNMKDGKLVPAVPLD